MPDPRAIFWDVGGVLLSNAWDHAQRMSAVEHFHLDQEEFHERHELVVSSFERGKITLDEYLDRTIFFRARAFTREAFRDFMFSLSQPVPGVLALAQSIAASGKYFMGTINNESRELNLYRIDKFGLRDIFRVFVTSCFVGFRKPERDIYRLALEITQVAPEDCCFIDDRPLNLERAASFGMKTIEMQTPDQLKKELEQAGVDF